MWQPPGIIPGEEAQARGPDHGPGPDPPGITHNDNEGARAFRGEGEGASPSPRARSAQSPDCAVYGKSRTPIRPPRVRGTRERESGLQLQVFLSNRATGYRRQETCRMSVWLAEQSQTRDAAAVPGSSV